MIERCAISNINNNMHLIGLVILILILCIVFLYYIKISNDKHNVIIEKYNTGGTSLHSLTKAPYLNTSGESPELQKTLDSHKNTRYPTSNDTKISTATLRPCQIHFNDDGTSKYIYEDGWMEFNTLISDEEVSTSDVAKGVKRNSTIYNVPYKKFGQDNNNMSEFLNFNETTKCFKKKEPFDDSLNTYKYKSNDLIKYRPDTYIEINVEENKKYDKKLFMQMNFDKLPSNVPAGKYKDDVLKSICSYQYNKDLNLGNIKLYRIKFVPKIGTNENINDSLITNINQITIKPVNNSEFIVSDENETKNVLPELLVSNSSMYTINNGNIRYEIRKNQVTGDAINGINVKVYKFNRNLDCSDDTIKSYETSDARFKSEELISVSNYVSEIINNGNPLPSDISISNIKDITNSDKLSGMIINGMSSEVLEKSLNLVIKESYNDKDEILQTLYYFICKLIAYSNHELTKDVVTLINNNGIQVVKKKSFIESFDTFPKFISLYQQNVFDDVRKKQLFDDIAKGKSILNYGIYSYRIQSLPQVKINKFPFYLENYYEIKIYTIDTIDKTLRLPEDTLCDILLVGGGGGGGKNAGCEGGGGGGGGAVIHITNFNLKSNTTYKFEIGGGGAAASGTHDNTIWGGNGGDTKIFTNDNIQYIIAKGGGGGGPGTSASGRTWDVANTNNGGSGGGGSAFGGGGGGGSFGGIETNIQALNYKQYGNNGGNATNVGGGGGGGGAADISENGAGGRPNGNDGGIGGNGIKIPIFSDNYYGAGGGGSTGNSCQGNWASPTGNTPGAGGKEGGGSGGARASTKGVDGQQHTGSGGGGASYTEAGNGGSGIAIVRYLKRPVIINDGAKGELTIDNRQSNIFKDGLYFKIFDGYYGSVDWPVGWHYGEAPDNLNFTKDSDGNGRQPNKAGDNGINSGIVTAISNLVEGTNNSISAENTQGGNWELYTVEWQGYFYAQKTGSYHFHTASDDASHLWIGDGAYTLDKSALTVNNGGLHGRHGVTGTIYLTAGNYYPMRILFGENWGGDNMSVYFHPPGDTWTTNGQGWYYHIPEHKEIIPDYNANIKNDIIFPKLITKEKDVDVKFNDSTIVKLIKNSTYTISSYLNTINVYHNDINFTKEFIHSGRNENQTVHSVQFEKDAICDILIVAGGGSGGRNDRDDNRGGGGGGAGGVIYMQNYNVKAGTYNIIVGKGGARGSSRGNNGANSSFGNFVARGGGGGGGANVNTTGLNGGSGGGGGDYGTAGGAGTGRTNQGFNGGNSGTTTDVGGGGGGGGGSASPGESYPSSSQNIYGLGGDGRSINITGTPVIYGKGGNGGRWYLGSNAVNALANSGNGGDGARFANAGNGGSGIVIIKMKGYSIYDTINNNIKITYDIEDDNAINLKNAQDNYNIIDDANFYLTPYNPSVTNVYKIGTKNQSEPYMKFFFGITCLTVGNITFEKGQNGGVIPTSDYEIIVTNQESVNSYKATTLVVLFYKNVVGDIYMRLSGYSNVFLYNTNINPNKQTGSAFDLSQDFRDYLAKFIPSKDSDINTFFGLDKYNGDVQAKINNRTSVTINANGSLQISGIKNDITKEKLEKLQMIYNNVKTFNAQSAERKPTITINSNKKIVDIIPSFKTDIVSYENPTNKHPLSYSSTYNIQPISNNYIYFRYPNQ